MFMVRRLLLLIPFLLGILTIGLATAAPALQGSHRTYAALIQKAAPPLPNEPLLTKGLV
jgi:ABC-type microcin C transport system permease subunit YejB